MMGLAARYPQDKGLEKDPEVVLSTGFDNYFWNWDWSAIAEKPATFEPVNEAPQLKFEPLVDKALKVAIPKGSHRGLNMVYLFKKELGEEPEEIYFRYYLRFADDWNPTLDGGKLHGIAGTYDRAGWGGRRSDGRNGWSARRSFGRIIEDPDNPFHGNTSIGTYAYYANMPGKYGNHWWWSRDALGVLEKNRWYSIEQYVKLNTPGQDDGAMRVWIDGLQAMERINIRHREIDTLKIDRIWMNVYHGGTSVSPHLQHLFIDNVVVARRYVGPLVD